MQSCKQFKSFSETYTDAQEQQRKQILGLIFPSNFSTEKQAIQKLDSDLKANFNLTEHKEYLINYTYKNHHADAVEVYRKFLSQKHPELVEPPISIFYQNQYFPDLKTLGQYRQKPSEYPNRHVLPLQENTFQQLDELFSQFGYIPNLQRFLTFFPRFLQKIRVVQKELFERSKIDQQTTYFLGLCAAAQMGCPYMVNRFTLKFLSKGGKLDWIENKKYSQKIAAVLPLNRKLARCLWEISSQDIQEIIQGGFWNINQLAIICQVLSFVQLQCVITLGLGLIPQQRTSLISTQNIEQLLKSYRQTRIQTPPGGKKHPLKEIISSLKVIIEQMKNNPNVQPVMSVKRSFRKERKTSEEQENYIIEPYMKDIGNQLTQQNLVSEVMNQISKFLPKFNPIDKRRDNKNNQFTCVDFNFQYMAFPRLQNLSFVTESTKKILAMIKESQEMGYQNFGNEMIGSTKEFRKAQRYYGQNLCGFSHPQYDYKRFMNNILPMPLKFYIRLLILSPLHMRRQVLDEICHQSGEVELFDLGHTAILIAAAKFKLSLNLTTYYFDY